MATNVDKLVDIHNKLSSKSLITSLHKFYQWGRPSLYSAIQEEIDGVNYSPKDINDVALNLSEIGTGGDPLLAMFNGTYVGGLITLLTERSSSEHVRIDLDLEGREFDYLAYGTLFSHELNISNTKGRYVGSNIAENGGFSKLINLKGIVGDYTGRGLASFEGYISLGARFENCEGAGIGARIRGSSKINFVSFADTSGNCIGYEIGNPTSPIPLVSYSNIEQKGLVEPGFSHRKKRRIIVNDIHGDYETRIVQAIKQFRENPMRDKNEILHTLGIDKEDSLLDAGDLLDGEYYISVGSLLEDIDITRMSGTYHSRIRKATKQFEENPPQRIDSVMARQNKALNEGEYVHSDYRFGIGKDRTEILIRLD